MSKPEIGGREPVTVDAVEGETYWWCRCSLPGAAVLRWLAYAHGLLADRRDRQAGGQAQLL